MGDKTKIEWADATWNPIVGCSKVSEGCDNCYAVGVVHRGMSEHHRGLTVRPEGGPTDWNGEIHRAPDSIFLKPLHWTRPRRVFVNSLSDLFHPQVDDLTIARIVAVMSLAPQHTFQVLTKRPKAMAAVLSSDEFWAKVALERRHVAPTRSLLDEHALLIRPLRNVWWGVSIESNRYAFRANYLRDTPAAVRWVSAEPLVGPLDQLDLTGIDWVVAGGESGAGARPMEPQWARDLRDRCTATATPFLFKQWGDWAPTGALGLGQAAHSDRERLVGPPIRDLGMFEVVARVGKRDAGRELDGRTWDEYPA